MVRVSRMSVAFVISAYKEPSLLRRLTRRLDGWPTALHIDAKVDLAPFAPVLAGRPDLEILPRHACYWGMFGHVAASLEGLRWFLRTGRDHVVLLTGQCYPLRPIAELEATLSTLGPRSIISHDPLPHPRWMNGGIDRVARFHVRHVFTHDDGVAQPEFIHHRFMRREFSATQDQ